ncbi:hypothetical protein V1522DRAFT_282603 [Lipomyces starkeyi]
MQTTTLQSNVQIVDPERNAVLTSLPDRGAEPAWSSSAVKNESSSFISYATKDDDTAEQPFVVFQSEFLDILGPSPVLRVVAEEKSFPFAHEAGIWIPMTREVFFTSNQFGPEYGAPKKITISKMFVPKSPDGNYKSEVILPAPDIVTANGGVNYGDGALFCSQGQGNIAGALIYMDIKPPYATKVLLNHFHGRPFNAPNDVVVLPFDGSIWFTDPNYGIIQGLRAKEKLPNQVYAYDPKKGSLRVVADGLSRPNGIAFSHDCKVCYITDTSTYDGTGGLIDHAEATIYAYDVVRSTGSTRPDRPYVLVNRRVFAYADCGAPDGIKVDLDGNVYTGCLDGVQVWDSDGVLIGKILVPGGVANFCFTDPGVLLLFNENRIYEARINAVGSSVRE